MYKHFKTASARGLIVFFEIVRVYVQEWHGIAIYTIHLLLKISLKYFKTILGYDYTTKDFVKAAILNLFIMTMYSTTVWKRSNHLCLPRWLYGPLHSEFQLIFYASDLQTYCFGSLSRLSCNSFWPTMGSCFQRTISKFLLYVTCSAPNSRKTRGKKVNTVFSS